MAPNSKYTGGKCPHLPQMEVTAPLKCWLEWVKDGLCIYSGGQTRQKYVTLTPE